MREALPLRAPELEAPAGRLEIGAELALEALELAAA
jgi:hypothetical protein